MSSSVEHPKGKTSFFTRIIWVLNIFALTGLALSYLAAYVSPNKIWWLALFGLGYEIMLFINLLFVVYWLIARSRRFWVSLVFILLGIGKIFGIIQFNSQSKDEKILREEGNIKVMSFNVRLFDLYNWFHNSETRDNIFHFLKSESPDIVCFQEFYSTDRKRPEFRNSDTLKYYLNSKYTHIDYTVSLRKTDHWGIATYSKYPIVKKQEVHFAKKGGNVFIMSDIKIGKDTIRVFNTHLESIHFGWNSYKFIENLNNDDIQQDEFRGGITILKQLKKAFVKRATQVEILHDSIEASPYPVLICGDFNDAPSSYSYEILSDDLNDAYRISGRGLGKTYSGPFPSFRIDYIFHDDKIISTGFRTIHGKLSDHYPVSCMMKLKK
ncbi:MAG TPA: endonuclease/exonuclease/phosphatase family protein [Bacteroidia bacterium]|nr:endonuclease/exonuclease/phosphatase family protein [Bacteroidia bacterium]MBP9922442.1 endonuclease/exonuclease/phosphatase family protein [Bacteroidia bacterium]HQV99002.1 endonuclease/exonuclease/phosphatase family protein [Bacteroidia bacterium]HQW22664.1 endonuclease/exonuclease/phosphatase family protein [Bacteroidia bacterium]